MKITYVGEPKNAYLICDIVRYFEEYNQEQIKWTSPRNAGIKSYYCKHTNETIFFKPYMLKMGLKIVSWTEKGNK